MDYIHDLRKVIGPRKIILNCAGALIIKENKILLQRRTDNGKWGFIGGLVEMNETYEQAALREIREETNLEVDLDTAFRHMITYSPGEGIVKDVVFFIAEAKPGRMINQECEVTSLEWLPFEQALNALTHDSDRETLRAANEYLKRKK